MYISQQYGEVGHVVDGLALKAFFEQVTVATVLLIIIVHVGACYALDGLSHSFIALTNEQVKVVAHKAVGVICAVASAGVPFVIVPNTHAVEGVDELVVVFLVFKDGLMINTTHHHMVYSGA